MKTQNVSRAVFVIIASLILFLPPSLSAQSIWVNQGQGKVIAIEFLKPNFDGEDNSTFATSAIFLSGRFPISSEMIFVAELPFSHIGSKDFDESESSIGNPYIGVEIRKEGKPFFTELGLRPPLAPDDKDGAQSVGVVTDFDRAEAFGNKVFTITGKGNYYRKAASNMVVRLRVGPTLFLDTGNGNFVGETELLLDYNAQVGYEGAQISLLGGFTGRLVVTQEDSDFGERTIHQLGAAASLNLGTVRPGIHVRLPLDNDLKDTIDFVYGLNLGIHLE